MRSSTSDAPAAGCGWLDLLAALADAAGDLILGAIDLIAGMVTVFLG